MELPAGLTSIHQTHWLNGMPFELVSAVLKPPGSPDASSSFEADNRPTLHPLTAFRNCTAIPARRAKLYLDFDGHFERSGRLHERHHAGL